MAIRARFLSVAAFLLLSFSLHAQISVVPPGPTTDDAVTLRLLDQCSRKSHAVVRTGFEIRVTPGASNICPGPPPELGLDVPLGELPAGQYRVIYERPGLPTATTTFVVRPDRDLPLRPRPWAIPTSGALVHFDAEDILPFCHDSLCSALRIELLGRVYTGAQLRRGAITFAFDAPAHAAGPVDMRVTHAGGTFDVPAALYYFDPAAPPDPSVFERVLFPVLFQAQGANGSIWRTDAIIANPNPWWIQNWNTVERLVCVDWPCGELLDPRVKRRFGDEAFPQGAVLHVPRGEADDLSFSLRIRDVSRDAESHGTQLPVLRERDLYRDETNVPLLDVPLDPRFRVKIRLYAYADPVYETTTPFAILFPEPYTPSDFVRLTRSCTGAADCARTPYYAEFDVPRGAVGATADYYIEFRGGSLAWAFASVTNNVTQQVTIISPDGKGGRP